MLGLFDLLIVVLIVGTILGIVYYWLIPLLPLPPPLRTMAQVLVVLIVIVFLLSLLFGGVGFHLER